MSANAAEFEAKLSVVRRAPTIFQDDYERLARAADRMFFWLLIAQWMFCILLAFFVAPLTWSGARSAIHPHVWTATLLGLIVIALPCTLICNAPGTAFTRYAVAVAQVLISAIMIHLTGGRIETHFHVFGSLALLAFYRDGKILIVASAVVAIDHLVRGYFWPASVFGIERASVMRSLEHVGWVVFEDVFLILMCHASIKEIRIAAERKAMIEVHQESIERKVRERTDELHVIRERYDLAIRGASVGIWDWDVLSSEIYVSPRCLSMLGFREEEQRTTFHRFVQLLDPSDKDRVLKSIQDHLRSKGEFNIDFRMRATSDEHRWVNVSGQAIWDNDGFPYRMAGSVIDISDRKSAEIRLQTLARLAPVGIFEANLAGEITFVNDHCQEISGWEISSLARNGWVQTIHPDDREATVAGWMDAVRRKVEYQQETRVIRPDQSIVHLVCSARPLVDDTGEISGFLGTLVDVTDRVRTAEELRKSKDAAEAGSVAKSEFIANMSHEIRTPMTAILGYTDLLAEHFDKSFANQAEREYIAIIKRNGAHLLSIINDVLDMSKIEAGKLVVEVQPASPRCIIEEVVSLMRVRATEKAIQLRLECQNPLPESIATDPVRLRQILMNLLGNAIKFTEEGEVSVAVAACDGPSPSLQFKVRDTGIGMTAEQMSRLFTAFEQADNSMARRFGGTGLGLSISQRLAGMLGGKVEVASEVGKGSMFTLTIPIRRIETPKVESDETARKKTIAPAAATGALSGFRVLLAEDGPDNQKLISFHLRKAGAEVTIVENGELAAGAALTADAENHAFDVILMDMQMPVMDGCSATRRLRRCGYSGQILALTAHAMPEDKQRCLDAGCNDHLTKPIDRNALIQAIVESQRRLKGANEQPVMGQSAAFSVVSAYLP